MCTQAIRLRFQTSLVLYGIYTDEKGQQEAVSWIITIKSGRVVIPSINDWSSYWRDRYCLRTLGMNFSIRYTEYVGCLHCGEF